MAISEVVAPHHQNRVAAQTLDWLQRVNFKATPSPAVLVQECLISSIERRVRLHTLLVPASKLGNGVTWCPGMRSIIC